MSVAERQQSRVLVAPHQVPPEARRIKKNAPSDQVRSFAAKRARRSQILLGAIARNSAGCCFNANNSVAEFVLLSIGGFPATA